MDGLEVHWQSDALSEHEFQPPASSADVHLVRRRQSLRLRRSELILLRKPVVDGLLVLQVHDLGKDLVPDDVRCATLGRFVFWVAGAQEREPGASPCLVDLGVYLVIVRRLPFLLAAPDRLANLRVLGTCPRELEARGIEMAHVPRTLGSELVEPLRPQAAELLATFAHYQGGMEEVLGRPEHALVREKIREAAAIPDPIFAIEWVLLQDLLAPEARRVVLELLTQCLGAEPS
mmetsp:Transcript_32304/g.89227  ORF Transcript_32304/g.89227 Transcript_32304/m.89227 type:complete len:233 (-) Transcript_32304:663-1361(-)